MPHIDDFWDDIVDDGLVDPDQGGRARARFIQVGGGLDTAVLENAQLGAEDRQTLLEMAAGALGRKLAAPTALADPDREAARHIPRNIIDRYGVMPGRDGKGRLILITPPLAPHVFNELKSRLGRSFDARIALEMDIRLALARHFDLPLPSRFEALRSGRQPGRSALSGVPARRPVPKPKGVAALMPAPAMAAPAPAVPSGNPVRSWLSDASGKLRRAREREQLFGLLAEAGGAALDGRFYLLAVGEDRIQCVAGAGLPDGDGPIIPLHRDSRLDHALRIGSSRLEDWSHDPDLTALYTALGRARPARVMIEPIRDGLDVVGVFVGDHGRAGIDRGVVGDLRRWLSRISTRLADLRDSRAPAPEPPVVEPPPPSPPPPPPRMSAPPSPPPRGQSEIPPADPFAPPTATPARRRRRAPLDLQELAEAARTAQATADALPVIEEESAPVPAPPAPMASPAPAASPAEPVAPPAPSVEPAEPPSPPPVMAPPAARPPLPAIVDTGLPFETDDDDPLAGFLSDPEIEAVADAIAADSPDAFGSTGAFDDLGGMGAPPNTLPSRPQAMPEDAAPVPSLFEAVLPRAAEADGAADEQGVPPPTRPARPSAGRSADPRAADAPPERSEERPGPTVNLRGPELDAERRRRTTADLGPRPADISVDELIEEARALGQNLVQPTSEPPPPRPAPIKARSTVDLTGDADDEPLDDPPPLDADDPQRSVRKTVNLRLNPPTPSPPSPSGEVLELDDADVLEVTDELPEVLDVDAGAEESEVVRPLRPPQLTPEAEALKARRDLEEADTGVFTVVGDPVEAQPEPPSAEELAALGDAETAELPEAVVDDVERAVVAQATPSEPPRSPPTDAGTEAREPSSPIEAEPAGGEVPGEDTSSDAPVMTAPEEPEAAAEVPAPDEPAFEPAVAGDDVTAAPHPAPDEPAPDEPTPDEPAAPHPTPDDEKVIDGPASMAPATTPPSEPTSVVEAPPSQPAAAIDEPALEDGARTEEPEPSADERDAVESAAPGDLFEADAEAADPVQSAAPVSDPPAPIDDLFGPAHGDAPVHPVELSDPPLPIDDLFGADDAPVELAAEGDEDQPGSDSGQIQVPADLFDPPDDELSDLDLVLSPPPAPMVSPTFEVIDALDLDGSDDAGADFDLDLGLEPKPADDPEPVESSPAEGPESDDASDGSEPVDLEQIRAAITALTEGDADAAGAAEEALVSAGADALEALFAIFPGPLVIDRYAAGDPAPVGRHGPVLRTICRIGAPAGPYLAERCSHLAPDVRYYAVYAFSAVREPGSLAAITPALTDKDPTVRAIACRVADSYRGDEIFGVLVAHLVNIVDKGRLADRRLAAEALGTLHAADGATPLIAMLGAPQPPLRDAAHKALVEIGRQDFGDDVWRWRTFFERSASRPRIEWLLDGLLSDQRSIRVGAFRELRRVTHQNYGYTPDAPPATRRASAERWVRWWQQTGRSKFGHYR